MQKVPVGVRGRVSEGNSDEMNSACKEAKPVNRIAKNAVATLFAVLLVLVYSVGERISCTEWGRAKNLEKSDSTQAVKAYCRLVRRDDRSSRDAVYRLSNMQYRCATVGMVGLFDLPDGEFGRECRRLLWNEVKQRTRKGGTSTPSYDPDSTPEERSSRMIEWQKWLESHPTIW
jgi:hypothetical protein